MTLVDRCVISHEHRTELEATENLPLMSDPVLPEQHRPGGHTAHQYRDEYHQRQQNGQGEQNQTGVEHPLPARNFPQTRLTWLRVLAFDVCQILHLRFTNSD